jgi:4-alpha-glucanotransferase
MAVWWNQAPPEERVKLGQLAFLRERLGPTFPFETAPFDRVLRDALLELLFASGSDLIILPIQDVFGWSDRVNVPALVSEENWTYRLPWPISLLEEQSEVEERTGTLNQWARAHGRTSRDA